MDLIIVLIGLTALIQSVPYLFFPGQVRKRLKKLLSRDDSTLKFIGLLTTVLSLAIIYLGVM